MSEVYREPELLLQKIEAWLLEKFEASSARGGILGISGGLDSAVLAAILRRVCGKSNMLGVMMPSHSDPNDEKDARELAEKLDIPIVCVDLTSAYDLLLHTIQESSGPIIVNAASNIKPRLRMTTLYAIGQDRNLLVCGATNKNEMTFGYFTKHGDSGVDLLPMADLLKGEVVLLAQLLGVPQSIITKAPSAGLFIGQTDEQEMGISYKEMDSCLLGNHCEWNTQLIVTQKKRITEHKRDFPPIAKL